jgi:triosephosphate isomerase
MAKKIVAGNWKMNLNVSEAEALVNGVNSAELDDDVRVILFPPTLFVDRVSNAKKGTVEVGVQNMHQTDSGAFTGEISISQAQSVGATVGLIGHSERREYNNEDNGLLKEKVNACIENNFDFIFCCGESLAIRETGREYDFVRAQLEESLFHLSADQMEGGVIAYEPIWAIGTGRTASAEQAEEMHANIRSWLKEVYNEEVAASVSILYGGSCKPSNSKELFACPNVDGGLIGGAALDAQSFAQIINSY